ncbi:hypothetical protein [Tunturiibacter gelidoferens]|uniref:Uncharacterized protein n=1 Tax=Tunturiibacter gelidiferens TaxID=3069689 RepID=A0A9X0QHG2_9BACT|nr:hypothetical protein [Edaphobacter lichenicola]MBB5330446.1 hypothetical protein [Edaphobacter lichenicola]
MNRSLLGRTRRPCLPPRAKTLHQTLTKISGTRLDIDALFTACTEKHVITEQIGGQEWFATGIEGFENHLRIIVLLEVYNYDH